MAAPDSLLILLIALALDFYLGAPIRRLGWRWHPMMLIDRAVKWCDEKLNRPQRSAADRRVRGAVAVLAFVGLMVALGVLIDRLGARDPLMAILVLIVVVSLVDLRAPHDALRELELGLAHGSRSAAETALRRLSDRDPVHLDDHGLARTGIEARAVLFARHGVGPILSFVAFGLAGMLVWWSVLALRRHAGGLDPGHAAYGWTARRAERIVTFVPDRVAGIGLAMTSVVVPRCDAAGALRTMRSTPGRCWPQAAIAGALGLALGGPRRYGGRVVSVPWIGSGRAQLDARDVVRARRLLDVASVALAAAIAAALAIRFLV